MLPIAGCRQPAIRSGAMRPGRCSSHMQPASGHHDAAHMRRSQPRPCLGARGRATRMPQGGKEFPWWKETNLFDACASSANAESKTPPGVATRGRSHSSGDRGGRSPRESAGYQVSRRRADSLPRLAAKAYACTRRPQRDGCRSSVLAMSYAGFMEFVLVKKQPQGPKAAHDTPVVLFAQQFFHFVFRGRRAVSETVASGQPVE